MSNDITHLLEITGPEAEIEAMLGRHIKMIEDCQCFNFATIIERPACVEATESGSKADAGWYALTRMVEWNFAGLGARNPMEHYVALGFKVGVLTTPEDFAAWLRQHHPDVIAQGEAQLRCFRETGCRSWYEWGYAYWGTRGNSYDLTILSREHGKVSLKFDTANGVATPVLRRLSEIWPALTINVDAVDEGGPEFGGVFADGHGDITRLSESRERYVRVMGREPYSDEDESTSPGDAP